MNYSDIWNYIGSVWADYDDKETIENFWEALNSGITAVNTYTQEIQKSRSLSAMSPTFDIGPEFYNVTYSGVDESVLTVLPIGSGTNFEFPIPQWTYSIPTLVDEYYYNGIRYSYTYNQGVDYTVSGYNAIYWLDTPPVPDPRYPATIARANLYAEHIYVINPVLMNTWAVFCGFNINDFASYSTFGQPYYTHLKMLIWALVYKQMQAPSIKNLRDALAISSGMPFAYSPGTTSSVNYGSYYTVTVNGITYTLPPGLLPIADGTIVAQFDVIAAGIDLYDNATSPTIVSQYTNAYNVNNTLVYDIGTSAAALPYSISFANTYMAKLWPTQLQVVLQQILMGCYTVFMDNQYIYMDAN